MPIYAPRITAIRKGQILDYKIFEFLKCIELNQPEEKIVKKAELVKVAMLNFIKARLQLAKPYKAEDSNKASLQMLEKLNTDMVNWKKYTFDEIKEFCLNRESIKKSRNRCYGS